MKTDSRRMTVIPKPDDQEQSIVDATFAGPVIKGFGPMTYVCGSCGTPLLQQVEFEQVQGVVVRCGNCREFNQTPLTHDMN
jgi:DNA-directed RNA polymerase subunit RPC12/RpoP